MKNRRLYPAITLVILFSLVTACSPAVVSTPTETATATPIPATPTNTPRPTNTPKPTETPNVVATQKYDEFNVLIEKLQKDGNIPTTAGETKELDPFNEAWAQMNWFDAWLYDNINSDFVFKARFKWESALESPEESGCGVLFGGQENNDFYAVFLTNGRIRFLMKRGANLYNVGKTNGSGVVSYDNPAEAEFILAVSDQKAYILADGEPTLYTLSADQTTKGGFGLSLLSGTNKDYGTRCEATDMMLWTAK